MGAASRPHDRPYTSRLQHPPLPDRTGPLAGRGRSSSGGSPQATPPTPCWLRATSTRLRVPPAAGSSPLADLTSVATLTGRPAGASTYQFYGIRLKCLDGILLSRDFRVRQQRVVDVKPGNTFPSDHFQILADISLSERAPDLETPDAAQKRIILSRVSTNLEHPPSGSSAQSANHPASLASCR